VWAVAFFMWYRDNPRSHPKVNAAEKALLVENAHLSGEHGDVPWRRFLSSPTTWLIWVQYFCFSYAWYFYITWFPEFLQVKYPEMNKLFRALLAGFPLFMGGIGSFCTARSTSWLVGLTGSLARARKLMAGVGFAVAAGVMLIPAKVNDVFWVIAALGFASFLCDFVIPVSWGACIDIGGRFAGTFSGSMNMMGNLGGFVSPIVIGVILDKWGHNYAPSFYMNSAVFALGAICWIFIDPVTSMDDAAPTQAEAQPT